MRTATPIILQMSSAECWLCTADSYIYAVISSCCFLFSSLKWKADSWNYQPGFVTVGAAVFLYPEITCWEIFFVRGLHKTSIKGNELHRGGASLCTGVMALARKGACAGLHISAPMATTVSLFPSLPIPNNLLLDLNHGAVCGHADDLDFQVQCPERGILRCVC